MHLFWADILGFQSERYYATHQQDRGRGHRATEWRGGCKLERCKRKDCRCQGGHQGRVSGGVVGGELPQDDDVALTQSLTEALLGILSTPLPSRYSPNIVLRLRARSSNSDLFTTTLSLVYEKTFLPAPPLVNALGTSLQLGKQPNPGKLCCSDTGQSYKTLKTRNLEAPTTTEKFSIKPLERPPSRFPPSRQNDPKRQRRHPIRFLLRQ